jgi:hypothetical protein
LAVPLKTFTNSIKVVQSKNAKTAAFGGGKCSTNLTVIHRRASLKAPPPSGPTEKNQKKSK